MTDPEIYRTLLGVHNRSITVDHAYGLLRQERDDRTRITRFDFLKAAGLVFAACLTVYLVMYFIPAPCK